MILSSDRWLVHKIVRKNKRADKLVRKGKFNRALKLMLETLETIEENFGRSNIALAKQHIKVARFRIKEARRVQYENMILLCNAQIDRVKLSQSFAGRLVLKKLSERTNHDANVLACSELFGLLHIAEATFHADKALEILQQSPNSHFRLYRDAAYLANKLYRFFDIPSESTDPASCYNLPAAQSNCQSTPHVPQINKGRTHSPAFISHANGLYVQTMPA